MIGTTPEGYYALTPGSDNFTITPDLLINSHRGLAALDGNDRVFGSTIADLISGNQGDDYLFGNDGNDLINGGRNNDSIDGGAADDILVGGTGQDVIWGNWGGDSLYGGEDSDLFVVQLDIVTTDVYSGDFIVDFNPAEDMIGLRGGFTEASVQLQWVQWGTLVKDPSTNLVLASVYAVTPEQLQGHLINVDAPNADITNNSFDGGMDLGVLNTTTPNYSYYYGWGLVDAAKAVAEAERTTPYPNIDYTPSVDPTTSNLADINVMNVPEVWNQGYTGKGVIVAVLDTGMDLKHLDLANNIWVNSKEANGQAGIDDDNNHYTDDVNGYDFIAGDPDPSPDFNESDNAHGTHVAGTIAAAANGNTYDLTKRWNVNGVAYNAQIMPVRVSGNQSSDEIIAKGIYYAVDNRAKVINMSLGLNTDDFWQKPELYSETKKALEHAKQKDVTVVIGAGNERNNFAEGLVTFPVYPSRFSQDDLAISVGAVDSSNGNNLQFADFSNPAGVKPYNFVVAPGVGVLSTIPGDTYAFFEGTSMAAPYVSGVIALMLEANPKLTVDQIQDILIQTANPQAITGIEILSTVIPPDVAIA